MLEVEEFYAMCPNLQIGVVLIYSIIARKCENLFLKTMYGLLLKKKKGIEKKQIFKTLKMRCPKEVRNDIL